MKITDSTIESKSIVASGMRMTPRSFSILISPGRARCSKSADARLGAGYPGGPARLDSAALHVGSAAARSCRRSSTVAAISASPARSMIRFSFRTHSPRSARMPCDAA